MKVPEFKNVKFKNLYELLSKVIPCKKELGYRYKNRTCAMKPESRKSTFQ